jgi:hypothetical protein
VSRRQDKIYGTPRVFHRRVRFATTGSAGSATGGVYLPLPPCRLTHFAINHSASGAGTADTTFLVDGLSDGSTGTTVFTQTNSVTDIPIRALGQPSAVDEGRAAVAATDGVDGGAFIQNGIYVKTVQNDALAEAMVVDLWFERLRFETVTLVAQSGVDGSAVVTRTLPLNGAGNLLGVQFDFQNTPATADVIIKADSTDGETLFTSTSSQTDFGPVALGIIGLDEGNAAVAATDGIGGGQVFRTGLFFDVAESDAYTSSNEKIIIYLWIRQ